MEDERNESCLLCNPEKLTRWYFEEDKFIVMDCKACRVPMYVWREHLLPTQEEVSMMVKHAKMHFPNRRLDFRRRAIQNHFHFHCR